MKKKLLSLILSAALLCNVGILPALAADGQPAATEGQQLADEQQPAAPTIGSSQETACPECGELNGAHLDGCSQYVAPPCSECGGLNGAHLESCPQYVAPAPQETAITGWQWVDEEEMLVDGALALPGASEENPALFADITALLPAAITAQVDGSEESVSIELAGWECEGYPEQGAFEGSFVFTAQLPEGYALAEGAPALAVPVELGGAGLMAGTGTIDINASDSRIFANGIPIVIKQNGSITSIYDEEGDLLTEDTDVSGYIIYGGWYDDTHNGNTSIVMESGTITGTIFGGSYQGTLTGDTHVTVNGGNIKGFAFGGNSGGLLNGNTDITLNGGTVGYLYGGSNRGTIAGSTRVAVNGGTATSVYGGSSQGELRGSTTVTLSAGTVTSIYGGGNKGSAEKTQLILKGGSYAWAYGGGYQCQIDSTHAQIESIPPSARLICGGGYGDTIQQAKLEVRGVNTQPNECEAYLYAGGYGGKIEHTQLLFTGGTYIGSTYRPVLGGNGGCQTGSADVLFEDWEIVYSNNICGCLDGSSVDGEVSVRVGASRKESDCLTLYLSDIGHVTIERCKAALFGADNGTLKLDELEVLSGAELIFTSRSAEIGKLSGAGEIDFQTYNQSFQPGPILVDEVAGDSRLLLGISGAGWNTNGKPNTGLIEQHVFFKGTGIDALSTPNCFGSRNYKVFLNTIAGEKCIMLGPAETPAKQTYLEASFEGESYTYGSTIPITIGAQDWASKVPITQGCTFKIRHPAGSQRTLADIQLDEEGKNARILFPDGSRTTVPLNEEDGTVQFELPVNQLLAEKAGQYSLLAEFLGNDTYRSTFTYLIQQDTGASQFKVTAAHITLPKAEVTSPIPGNRPETGLKVADDAFYTAELVWSPNSSVFQPNIAYSAGIRVFPKKGYSLSSEVVGDMLTYDGQEIDISGLRDSDGSILLENILSFDAVIRYIVATKASPAEAGTVKGEGIYLPGEQVSLHATAHAGWRFITWLKDGKHLSEPANYTFTALGNQLLTALFSREYQIGVTVQGSGSIQGDGAYLEDEEVALKAIPDSGWKFLRWEENGQTLSTQADYTITADKDRTLTAVFEKLPVQTVTIAVVASPAEGGSITGGGSYPLGASVSLQATPNTGWKFLRWEENGQTVGSATEFAFTADKDRALTAVFEKEPEPPADKESKTELGSLSEVPEGLKNTPFNRVEKIVAELIRKVTVQTGYTADSFAAYDVQLLIRLDGGKWQAATEEDFPAEGLPVILPYPQGTGKDTHDFVVTHMFTLTSVRLGTTAGETEQPPVVKTEKGLQVTFRGLSPVGIAWKAIGQGEEPGGITTTGSGSDDSPQEEVEDEYSFWQRVKRQIEGAKKEATIRINVRDYRRMPLSVMKALRDREDVSLVIRWDGGKPITIPAGRAPFEDRRAYYPLSYLASYDFGLPAAEDAGYPDKTNPGTGAPDIIR